MRNPHAWIRMADAPAIRSQVVRVVTSSLLLAVTATASATDKTLIKVSDDLIREFYLDDKVSFAKYRKANPWGLVSITKSRCCTGKKAPGGDRRPSGRWRDAGAQGRRRRDGIAE